MFIINYLKFLFSGALLEKSKMVLIVRTDINMSRGKIGAQCAHAATECYSSLVNKVGGQKLLLNWKMQGQPKIVLQINNERELLALKDNAHRIGLITAVIRDAGRTQLHPGTITVLGIGPGPVEVVDKVTSKLRLL